ncbi:hypothetical protein AVEN_33132-1 [Araneus ventricosus]|uniref:Uncharacterized protein n=1 Tax=Araneus ventricosus TaxID=182803 RepID=A0A4Y2MM73_ARAVE|nr:hypothetical protein AVEN_33132-1 [Araneus ventricosus]
MHKNSKKCKNLKSQLTNGEWWSNDRTRRCINSGFYGNLNGAFHGNHLRRNHKIAFSVDLEVDNKEEISTLPLASHYQLYKSSSPMQVSPTIICVVRQSTCLRQFYNILKRCLCVEKSSKKIIPSLVIALFSEKIFFVCVPSVCELGVYSFKVIQCALNFADFSLHYLKKNDDLVKYFHEKLNCGRQLGLSPQLILEGLTDGLPTQFKHLMTVQPPNTPTEWLTLATKLFKIQESSEQNAVVNNEPPMRTRRNFTPRQPTIVPRS